MDTLIFLLLFLAISIFRQMIVQAQKKQKKTSAPHSPRRAPVKGEGSLLYEERRRLSERRGVVGFPKQQRKQREEPREGSSEKPREELREGRPISPATRSEKPREGRSLFPAARPEKRSLSQTQRAFRRVLIEKTGSFRPEKSRLAEGVIWAEVLGPPRSRAPRTTFRTPYAGR